VSQSKSQYADLSKEIRDENSVKDKKLSYAVSQTWCHWHRGYTDTGRLITVEEQGSGPGGHVYACAPCRAEHRLLLWEPTA
jgi:hypothetical protein